MSGSADADDVAYVESFASRFVDPVFFRALGTPVRNDAFSQKVLERLRESGSDPADLAAIRASLDAVPPSQRATREWILRESYLPQVFACLSPEDADRASRVAVGTAYTRSINALTILAPSGNPVILTDQGATTWLRMLALAFLMSLSGPFGDRGGFDRSQALGAMLLKAGALGGDDAFGEAMTHYFALRDADDPRLLAWNRVSHECELFMLLHEFGHALLGHLEHVVPVAIEPASALSGARVFVHQQQQELEADAFAASRLSRLSPTASMSANLFLAAMKACEDLRGGPTLTTHPGWAQRWQHVEEASRSASEDQAPEHVQVAVLESMRECVESWLQLAQAVS